MFKAMGWLFATQVAGVLVALAVGVLLSRHLGAHGQGLYQLTILVPVALTLMVAIGGSAAPSFLVARGESIPDIVGWILVLAAGSTLLAATLLTAFPVLWPQLVREAIAAHLRLWLLGYVPLQIVANGAVAILVAQNQMVQVFWAGIAPRLGQLAALLAFTAYHGLTVFTAAMVYVLMPLVAITIVAKTLRGQAMPRYRGAVIRQALSFGIRGHLGNVAQFLNYRLGLYFTGLMLMPRQVGFYWLAVTVSELLWYGPGALAGVLLPRVAKGMKSGRDTALLANLAGWASWLAASAMALVAPWLVPAIWGKPFAGAVPILWVLLPGAAVFAWSKILSGDLAGQGYPQWGTWSSLAGFGVLLLGGLAAVANRQVIWMASAQSASYAVATGVMIWGFLRIHSAEGMGWQALFVPRVREWRRLVRGGVLTP